MNNHVHNANFVQSGSIPNVTITAPNTIAGTYPLNFGTGGPMEYKVGDGRNKAFVFQTTVRLPQVRCYERGQDFDVNGNEIEILTPTYPDIEIIPGQTVTVEFEEAPMRGEILVVIG
jgi:hypothetical protein